MGIFSRLLGRNKDNKKEEGPSEVFYAKQDKEMEEAYEKARTTFHYFWRALYWEYRRIIPAHDLAIVKVLFKQRFEDSEEPVVEQMWLSNIDFDGEDIKGVLMNSPNVLTNVKKDDVITAKLEEITDWMFSSQNKTYGGYTIQLLRSKMDDQERKQHDNAWGLNFGDYNAIEVVYQEKEHSENLEEHPMSVNMEEKTRDFLNENPDVITEKDAMGLTMLHKEAIAGNRTCVNVLLELGVDKTITDHRNKTALDYALKLNWKHLIPVLE